ncbi:hypothetical protein DPD11_19980, partial [Salmonella enterica subsp. salamae]|nr:hypothetical protein [Salmonella enterica]ECI4073277.1 hypothetical protein [Salmonella enterica subsp. salamae]
WPGSQKMHGTKTGLFTCSDEISSMKHENYLMFYIGIRRHIKIGNSQPFKAMCQIRSVTNTHKS